LLILAPRLGRQEPVELTRGFALRA